MILGGGYDTIIIPLHSYIQARYIKISLESKNYLHFKKIEIFKRKYPALIVATRFDGSGGRLMAMLNAMYIAKKTGAKFGFIWDERELHDKNDVFVDNQDNIFDSKYLKEYSYTNSIKVDYCDNRINYIGDYSNFLKNSPWRFGWKIADNKWLNNLIFTDFNLEDYKIECQKFWENIGWNADIKSIISQAIIKSEELGSYVALHLRNGDVVSHALKGVLFTEGVRNRLFPIEIAIGIVEKFLNNQQKVVLFSPDQSAKIVRDKFDSIKQKNIILAQDLMINPTYNQKLFFDLVLMAKSKEIISSSFSTYALCAGLIYGSKLSTIDETITRQEQLCLLNKYQNYYTTPELKSASYFYWYKLLERENNVDELIKICELGFIEDNNFVFMVRKFELLLNNQKFKECDEAIKKLSSKDKINVISGFFPKNIYNISYKTSIDIFITTASIKYPYISYIASKISVFQKDLNNALKFINYSLNAKPNNEEFIAFKNEIKILINKANPQQVQINIKDPNKQERNLEEFTLQYGTAKSRIHNQLSYKLGQAMIENSKSIWGYIRMPYILSYIKETHQKEQKLYQEKIKANPSLKLPPLESYPDYNEAIKIKEHLSYKLGEALINADKSKLKLGYLTLWFKCKNITKEHKDNHKDSPNH
ncbi:hypothetical protein [Campylobacter lanienae]|uniref:hypothetical protein n=1 Tax=Campylobacter lanienae TaxID=75658 RepID=UPI000BB42E8B|nr:hypothetical protein [Campylobacter lanienae]